MPGVLERFDLRVRVLPLRRLEKDIVIGVRIERRVEIDEVHAFIRDMLAQNMQIVAEVERVGHTSPVTQRSADSKNWLSNAVECIQLTL